MKAYLEDEDYTVELVNDPKTVKQGKALLIETVGAQSSGNAFIGHRKYVEIRGTLYTDGKAGPSFTALRVSGGGLLGGFKSSCTVLHRCQKTLAKDVVTEWLKNPEDGIHLGD